MLTRDSLLAVLVLAGEEGGHLRLARKFPSPLLPFCSPFRCLAILGSLDEAVVYIISVRNCFVRSAMTEFTFGGSGCLSRTLIMGVFCC